MKIVLHASENQAFRHRFNTRIAQACPQNQIILTDSRQDLSDALCRPLHNISVLIAFISDTKAFDTLLSLKPLFDNVKLILIFCERVDDIQNSVLRLEPLYTGCFKGNFQDIISVLQRIEQKQKQSSINSSINLSPKQAC